MSIKDRIISAVHSRYLTWESLCYACLNYMTDQELSTMLSINNIDLPVRHPLYEYKDYNSDEQF